MCVLEYASKHKGYFFLHRESIKIYTRRNDNHSQHYTSHSLNDVLPSHTIPNNISSISTRASHVQTITLDHISKVTYIPSQMNGLHVQTITPDHISEIILIPSLIQLPSLDVSFQKSSSTRKNCYYSSFQKIANIPTFNPLD